MKITHVVLRHIEDADGTRRLDASLTAEGNLRIEGWDFGAGVKQIFGVSEYEWAWTIPAASLPALRRALDSGDDRSENRGDDLLAALAARFSGDNAAQLDAFLAENKIPTERWSRLGD